MTARGALQQTGGMSADRRLRPGPRAAAPAEDRGVPSGTSAEDPYRWLEDVTGERALGWVRERNAETVAKLTGGSRFESLRAEIREVVDSTERIPYITRRGGYRYNFWRDRQHPRGLWRRTTLAEYRKERPDWEILLDLDALARDEGENWVFGGAQCLRPNYRRALVSLSRGGADAAVVREFDIERREFVTDGFQLPEAKSIVDWVDADRIYVATDFGPGTLTTCGYPRTVRQWRRGTPLAEAELVYEGKPDDIGVYAYHDDTEGFERDFVQRVLDFYRCERYERCGDRLRRVEVPDDAIVGVHRRWLLIELRSEWTVGETYPAGCLLAADFDEFMARGRDASAGRGLRVLFTPDERTSLAGYSWTRRHLILDVMHDVVSHLSVLTSAEDWRAVPLTGTPPLCSASAYGTDPDTDDEYLLDVDGFLTPSTLAIGTIGAGPAVVLKREPSFFDGAGLAADQHFAVSDDGTRIPYFVVAPDNAVVPSGGWPTLLHGYGGFEVSLRPGYHGALGRAWLARGGCHVVANIRGGGEYGPRWHSAAGHAALPYAADRRRLDRRVRRSRRPGRTRAPAAFLPIPPAAVRPPLPAYPAYHLHSRRPRASWPCPQAGGPDARIRPAGHLLRERRGRPWRRGGQRAGGLHVSPGLRVPLAPSLWLTTVEGRLRITWQGGSRELEIPSGYVPSGYVVVPGP
jgi:prolyl oligopeptidase